MVNAFQLEKAGDDLDPDVLTSVLFFGLMIHVHPTLSVCRNQESRLESHSGHNEKSSEDFCSQ